MKRNTTLRPLGLALMVAGFGIAATSVHATGPATLKIESLTTTPVATASDMANVSDFNDDGGFVAITTTKVLVGGDNDSDVGAGYSVGKDLAGGADADFGNESVVIANDLVDQTAYVFPTPMVPNSIGGAFSWDEIVKLDASGNVASRIDLSASIDITSDTDNNDDCILIGSGIGFIGVWDACTPKFWTIAVPSGTVTEYTSGISGWSDYDSLNLWPVYDYSETDRTPGQAEIGGSGVLEYFDGAFHMLLPAEDGNGDLVSISRFSIFAPSTAPEEVLALEDSPDLYSFAFSSADNLWCAHTEGTSTQLHGAVSLNEPIGCWSAATSTSLPTTGSGSTGLTALGLGLVAMGAFVTVRSRRRVVA